MSELGKRERPSVASPSRKEKEEAGKQAFREREKCRPLWTTLLEREKVIIGQTLERSRAYRSNAVLLDRR